MVRWLLILAALGTGWHYATRTEPVNMDLAAIQPAEYVRWLSPDKAPYQKAIRRARPLRHGDYTLTPLARFQLAGRVLGSKRYRFDREAELAPVDLAMGWGPMARSEVLNAIEIRQAGRWYHWRADQMPVPRRDIETNSANMHIIAASDTVAEALKRVRAGDRIRFRGFLVQVQGDDGWQWRSSLRRDDTGSGACEVVVVDHLEYL